MGSGLLYAGLLVAWAIVGVHHLLRRHEAAEAAAVAESSARERDENGRLLPRRGPATGGRAVRSRPAPEDALPPSVACLLGPSQGARAARARLAARRRRVLLALAALGTVVALLAVAGVLPVVAVAPPAVLVLLYVVHLRGEARRARALDHRRRATRARALARLRDEERRAAVAAAEAREAPPVPEPDAPVEVPAALAATGTDWPPAAVEAAVEAALDGWALTPSRPLGEPWTPVPVPLPTYVTKPRAVSPARRIDLSGSAWVLPPAREAAADPAETSSGGREEPPLAELDLEERRAVGR